MGNTRRTFLLGAGFSKAIADGPTMKELWLRMEKRFEFEKHRRTEFGNLRIEWFEQLDSNLKKLESISNTTFGHVKEIQVKLRENLEYVFTLIDLSLSAPKLYKENSTFTYPAVPIPFSKGELVGMKKNLQTFLYLILVDLKAKSLGIQFANSVSECDNIITFNYDLVLEQLLWGTGIWSPLDGYVGVSEFEKVKDKNKLVEANRIAQLTIHKMHGSINWQKLDEYRTSSSNTIVIGLDNLEHQAFHFDDIGNILGRHPENVEFVGRYEPGWILPSFIKPFESKEFYHIWQSAIRAISATEELVIIGYSFRPEDSNAFLLLSMLPAKCKIILVDPKYEEMKERLESKGFNIHPPYETLEKYLEDQ